MSLNPAAPLAPANTPVRIPVLGHLARALGQDINLAFYLVTIFVTAVVLAVMTWGLPALVITALAMVPLMFAWFIIISLP